MGRTLIGMIGLGLLGSAIAERLLGRGFRVLGFDLEADRREANHRIGVEIANDPTEVARSCDRIILSLPTGAEVTQVIACIERSLRPGQTILDTTTGGPKSTAVTGRRLAAHGVNYLDATVSGSSEQARRGDVVIMVGGDKEVFEACRDVFEGLARDSFHVGPVGSGAGMKLATNLVLGLNRAVLAEGLAFARSVGLDPGLTLDVLRKGAAYSRVMDTKGPKMIAGDFTPEARLSQHLKDVRLILAEAKAAGTATPLSVVHQALLEEAEAAGYGPADNSAIIRAFDRKQDLGAPNSSPDPQRL